MQDLQQTVLSCGSRPQEATALVICEPAVSNISQQELLHSNSHVTIVSCSNGEVDNSVRHMLCVTPVPDVDSGRCTDSPIAPVLHLGMKDSAVVSVPDSPPFHLSPPQQQSCSSHERNMPDFMATSMSEIAPCDESCTSELATAHPQSVSTFSAYSCPLTSLTSATPLGLPCNAPQYKPSTISPCNTLGHEPLCPMTCASNPLQSVAIPDILEGAKNCLHQSPLSYNTEPPTSEPVQFLLSESLTTNNLHSAASSSDAESLSSMERHGQVSGHIISHSLAEVGSPQHKEANSIVLQSPSVVSHATRQQTVPTEKALVQENGKCRKHGCMLEDEAVTQYTAGEEIMMAWSAAIIGSALGGSTEKSEGAKPIENHGSTTCRKLITNSWEEKAVRSAEHFVGGDGFQEAAESANGVTERAVCMDVRLSPMVDGCCMDNSAQNMLQVENGANLSVAKCMPAPYRPILDPIWALNRTIVAPEEREEQLVMEDSDSEMEMPHEENNVRTCSDEQVNTSFNAFPLCEVTGGNQFGLPSSAVVEPCQFGELEASDTKQCGEHGQPCDTTAPPREAKLIVYGSSNKQLQPSTPPISELEQLPTTSPLTLKQPLV